MNQNTQTAERPRGRPADADQQDLRIQILDTAEKLFAARGYAATPIRQIADVVGINPALVHYYFGNKKELLKSVLERALEPLELAIARLHNDPKPSPETIANLLVNVAAEHPNVPRLIVREVMLPGGEMQQYFLDDLAPRLGGALPLLISREKSAGRIHADADPAISALLVMSMCVYPFVSRPLAESGLGIDFDRNGIEKLKQQITGLLRRGMTK